MSYSLAMVGVVLVLGRLPPRTPCEWGRYVNTKTGQNRATRLDSGTFFHIPLACA